MHCCSIQSCCPRITLYHHVASPVLTKKQRADNRCMQENGVGNTAASDPVPPRITLYHHFAITPVSPRITLYHHVTISCITPYHPVSSGCHLLYHPVSPCIITSPSLYHPISPCIMLLPPLHSPPGRSLCTLPRTAPSQSQPLRCTPLRTSPRGQLLPRARALTGSHSLHGTESERVRVRGGGGTATQE